MQDRVGENFTLQGSSKCLVVCVYTDLTWPINEVKSVFQGFKNFPFSEGLHFTTYTLILSNLVFFYIHNFFTPLSVYQDLEVEVYFREKVLQQHFLYLLQVS